MAQAHILVLGGTAEGRAIAAGLDGLAGMDVTTSLAGRTESPSALPGRVRVGGFGGAEGLAGWIRENGVAVLVDATHPFAARISANAVAASRQVGVPLVVHERAAWTRRDGDEWIDAGSVEEAAELLGRVPRTVFLAIGRQELAPFDARPWHRYVVRSVDPVAGGMLQGAVRILDRGPFDEEAERDLLVRHGIEIVVAKNSGGDATYAKIAAARALSLPVIMVQRPARQAADAVNSVEEAIAAVHRALAEREERGA